MFKSVLQRLPGNGEKSAEAEQQQPVSITDPSGRTVGMEDPNDPALLDDPAIFASDVPTVAAPPVDGTPSKSLIDSRGKPFIDPRLYGGMSLDQVSAGKGEPLNVIISALSTPDVLTRKGVQGYLRSLDFDMECFGLHSGGPQKAFLDPRGWVDENFLYRQVYTPFDHIFGTCIESLRGGNHIRAWQQQGTGAWFLATSREENVTKHHMIIPDGYNIGRDELVRQSQQNKDGITTFMFKKYQTKVDYITGLMQPGIEGVNHEIATDGKVALLTIKILSSDDKALLKAKRKAVAQQKQTVERITVSGTPAEAAAAAGTQTDKAKAQAQAEAGAAAAKSANQRRKRLSFAKLGHRDRPVATAVA